MAMKKTITPKNNGAEDAISVKTLSSNSLPTLCVSHQMIGQAYHLG